MSLPTITPKKTKRGSIGSSRLTPAPWLILPAGLALIFVLVPFVGMFVEVQWGDLWTLLSTREAKDALWLSLKTCLVSTVLSVVFGVPLAHLVAHENTRAGKQTWLGRTLSVMVTLPMVLPPVVAGLALLITFGRRGLVGAPLHAIGIDISFSTIAVIMAQMFVAMPFLIVSLEGALRTRGNNLEMTARNLGASRTRVFFEITLPLTLPAVASGTALTFSRALGEFGATITFAGSLQGVTRTLPLEIYFQREIETDLALALAVVLLVFATLVIGFTSFVSALTKRKFEGPGFLTTHEEAQSESTIDTILKLRNLDRAPHACDEEPTAVEVHGGVTERGVYVDAEIKKHCITALVGPNGVGKSTVLGMIAGTLPPDVGTVNIHRGSKKNLTVVWLEQRAFLFPHKKVLDNVAFGPRARGIDTQTARERALKELEAVGCLHLKDRGPTQLSGGQQQRVAIARALAVDPDLVLLDEPFATVDSEIAWSLRLVLKDRIRATQATAVMVTHDMVDANMMADQIVVLEKGRTAESGNARAVLENPTSDFLINLTSTNKIGDRPNAKVVRPENFLVVTEPSRAGVEGTVKSTTFMPSGSIAIVELDSGQLITVSINAYNRGLLVAGNRVRLEESAL